MDQKEINRLIQTYMDGICNKEEQHLIESHFLNYIDRTADKPTKEQLNSSFDSTYKRVASIINKQQTIKPKLLSWKWIPYAAAILLVCGLLTTWFFQPHEDPITGAAVTEEILPGGNRATLKIGNGQTIALSEHQSGIAIENKSITYMDGTSVTNNEEIVMQGDFTLQTPLGGTYQMVLPDGTKVWLNADTELKYAADMGNGTFRKVHLEGEAYFEVAKDFSRPFVVETSREHIKVLGTHFNVSCYVDEELEQITLLEGGVQINDHNVLKPGQQAVVDRHGNVRLHHVNADRQVAWKNGKFVFASERLESVMLKLSRWYNVEIVYTGSVSDKRITGTVSRFENIHKLLDMITYMSDVKFKIEGRRITVMP